MNQALLEAFRHNAWATKHLLAFCRELSEEQLSAATDGTFGDILATFDHIVRADGDYLKPFLDSAPSWVDGDDRPDLDTLKTWADEAEQLWEQVLSEPIDGERLIVVDNGAHEVRAGIFVAQALHHGNAHREQICATVTSLGLQPPDVQAWGFAWATGRIRQLTADS